MHQQVSRHTVRKKILRVSLIMMMNFKATSKNFESISIILDFFSFAKHLELRVRVQDPGQHNTDKAPVWLTDMTR